MELVSQTTVTFNMYKILVLLGLLGVALGAPQSKESGVPMLDGRIVGGQSTDISRHPYIVSVQRNNTHYCGGALISADWVVTAAHCVTDPVRYSIRAGSSLRSTGGQVINVTTVIWHSNYSAITIDYDIAVLRLNTSVNTPNAIPIALPNQGASPGAGYIATITGWGSTSEGGPGATVLQVVDVPIVSQANCRMAYGQNAITDRMFCAGVLGVGGRDACQGDSGGPVVVSGLLAGLVSWGTGCARPLYPGVKTSIPVLRNWIRNSTGI